jgi:hypothetical protein
VALLVVLPVVLVSTFGWCCPEVQVGDIRGLAAQASSWLGHIFDIIASPCGFHGLGFGVFLSSPARARQEMVLSARNVCQDLHAAGFTGLLYRPFTGLLYRLVLPACFTALFYRLALPGFTGLCCRLLYRLALPAVYRLVLPTCFHGLCRRLFPRSSCAFCLACLGSPVFKFRQYSMVTASTCASMHVCASLKLQPLCQPRGRQGLPGP